MPPFRVPSIQTVLFQMFERAWLFLKRAGTIILAISVVLWALASYPKMPAGNTQIRAGPALIRGQYGPYYRTGD